ncbi:MAG: succinyl-diaminopimelate desuccinylase [Alphaproteobacteria bacterium]|nr:succinyl-diaminopimelate desuccinylase [Alphaproteobacteria bacterium]
MAAIDPVALASALIRCPSVTPADAGALDVVQQAVEPLGFTCHRLRFSEDGTPDIDNLYARLGDGAPNLCFAGHTDVVPPGDPAAWRHDPFSGAVENGHLHGRGAADMKGAIACFIAAATRLLAEDGPPAGSISLLITGDEEGPSINGTRKMLDWLADHGERLDHCVVGEPTNPEALGEMVKIGRRGSMTCTVTVNGVQGHTAYPHRADNPAHRLITLLHTLTAQPLDQGSAHFEPSTLQISSIDIGNPAANVIPAQAHATFNIRFNDLHSSESLTERIRSVCQEAMNGARDPAVGFELEVRVSGESFLTPPGGLSELIADAAETVTGRRPALSTSGGTSDARFIKDHCPVAEFGLVGQTMHKVDEQVAVADLLALSDIYLGMLRAYFAAPPPGRMD